MKLNEHKTEPVGALLGTIAVDFSTAKCLNRRYHATHSLLTRCVCAAIIDLCVFFVATNYHVCVCVCADELEVCMFVCVYAKR